MITSLGQLDFEKRYTYAEYFQWKIKERTELYKGKLHPLATPGNLHQLVSGKILTQIMRYAEQYDYDVFTAPTDVHLMTSEAGDTLLQPDLFVVCDKEKLNKNCCVGTPDLTIEVLSPGNGKREMKYKLKLYEEAGVPEYWIFDPERQAVLSFVLDEKTGKYQAFPPLTNEDFLECKVLPGLRIELGKVFPEE